MPWPPTFEVSFWSRGRRVGTVYVRDTGLGRTEDEILWEAQRIQRLHQAPLLVRVKNTYTLYLDETGAVTPLDY